MHHARRRHVQHPAKRRGAHSNVVQERLGSASMAITADTSSHVARGKQRAAADTFSEAMEQARNQALRQPMGAKWGQNVLLRGVRGWRVRRDGRLQVGSRFSLLGPLLGLLWETEAWAARALVSLGAELEEVARGPGRSSTLARLSASPSRSRSPGPTAVNLGQHCHDKDTGRQPLSRVCLSTAAILMCLRLLDSVRAHRLANSYRK